MTGLVKTALAITLLAAANPALGEKSPHDEAQSALRACLVAGAGGAPRSSLLDAVRAIRTLCASRIEDLREIRVSNAVRGLPPSAVEAEELRVTRELDNEIAIAISNFTGLQE